PLGWAQRPPNRWANEDEKVRNGCSNNVDSLEIRKEIGFNFQLRASSVELLLKGNRVIPDDATRNCAALSHLLLCLLRQMQLLSKTSSCAVPPGPLPRYRSLRTPANYLVINLAVADFIIMMEAPLFIYNSIHQGPALGSIGCTVYALMGALGGTVAIATLTVISIDRYNVVVYPLNPNRSTTKLKCYFLIAFTWVYGLLFAGLPALEIGLSRYTAEGYMTACSFDYLDRSEKARVFMFVYFVFAWVVPFTVISFCYARILFVVINANSIQSSKSKNKTEVKLAGVVVGIIGLWFAAWTPYAVVAMLGVFGYEEYLTPLNSMIPAVFAKIAACIDPYFYAINHPRYRQMLERMFCNRGIDAGNSQYQTSHYNTRGGSRAGDSVGDDSVEANQPASSIGGARAASIRVGGGGRSSRLVGTTRGNYASGAPGAVRALKKQASNGDETSLEVSLEM
uniref:G-protein coupled receptors family 1 profile domain-containing protein n=1 Tax=Anopheles atroparvus TaxID=41427 RepID=A0AAG5D8B1_ANOAO